MNINSRIARANFTGYASGSIASFTGLREAPIKIRSYINAIQEGSGDPAPDNIRPISGWSECNVVRCGKNLLDSSLLLGASGWSKDDEGVYSGLNSAMYIYTTNNDVWKIFKPNYQYTMTVKTKSDVEGRRLYFNFYYTDGTVDGINTTSNDTTWQTLTLASNPNKSVVKIQISYNGSAKCYIDDLQLELGSTVTAYEAYTGNTYTIQLGDTYYGGSLDVTNGVLTVTDEIVDLGALTFNYQSQNCFYAIRNDVKSDGVIISSAYRYTELSIGSARPDLSISLSNYYGLHAISIKDTRYDNTSITDFRTQLNGIQAVYELATPITVQLTPTQIEQIIGTNNIFSDTGNVEVYYVTI